MQENINFSKMADEWNSVADVLPNSGLKPKRASQLKRHWKRVKKEANTKLTISGLEQELKDLKRELK